MPSGPRSKGPECSPRPQPVDSTDKVRDTGGVIAYRESFEAVECVRMHSSIVVSLAVYVWSENVCNPIVCGFDHDVESNVSTGGVVITQVDESDTRVTVTGFVVVEPRDTLYS